MERHFFLSVGINEKRKPFKDFLFRRKEARFFVTLGGKYR